MKTYNEITKPTCLGHQTELFSLSFGSYFNETDDYWCVQTPEEPGFFWGHFMLFKNKPFQGCYEQWIELYKREYTDKDQGFISITWDSSEYDPDTIQQFLENGFTFETCKVLTAASVQKPPKFNENITIEKVISDEQWKALEDVHIDPEWDLKKSDELPFIQKRMRALRKMCEAGMGHRFAAVLDGKIVGDLGIYFDGNIGRFSSVATHRDFRRLGVCGTLVYLSSQYAFEHMNTETLVMIADADYHAAGIYESVGFSETEKMYSLLWKHDRYKK